MPSASCLQAESIGEDEKKGREDATQAVVKLNAVIQSVQEEMAEARAAADRCHSAGSSLAVACWNAAIAHLARSP